MDQVEGMRLNVAEVLGSSQRTSANFLNCRPFDLQSRKTAVLRKIIVKIGAVASCLHVHNRVVDVIDRVRELRLDASAMQKETKRILWRVKIHRQFLRV